MVFDGFARGRIATAAMGAPPPRHLSAHRVASEILVAMARRHGGGNRQTGSIAGGGGHVTGGGVRCGAYGPGQFDFAMGAYLDRLILALSFAVGRWHFWVVRHATRCARLWLAWAVVGGGQLRLGVRVKSGLGADGRARIRRDYGVNGGFLESSGRRERESLWSNDGGRGEATDGFMSSSVQVLGGGRRVEEEIGDVTLLQANSAFPTSLACTWEYRKAIFHRSPIHQPPDLPFQSSPPLMSKWSDKAVSLRCSRQMHLPLGVTYCHLATPDCITIPLHASPSKTATYIVSSQILHKSIPSPPTPGERQQGRAMDIIASSHPTRGLTEPSENHAPSLQAKTNTFVPPNQPQHPVSHAPTGYILCTTLHMHPPTCSPCALTQTAW
ncbi:hypothetical protein Q7P36_002421 [Cladosporium allicinum]